VVFEVNAEVNGFRVQTVALQSWEVPRLVPQAEAAPVLPVWSGPGMFMIEGGGYLTGVFVDMPDGKLRVMSYGDDALALPAAASATLLVRSEDPPPGVADWQLFDLDDWRSLAFPFDGVRLDEPCLGAPCWEFSAEAREALLTTDDDEYAELRLAPDPGVPTAASLSPYLRGKMSAFYLFKLAGREGVELPE
jgi:hypothetical protein